jgi:hypothetical protein
MLNFEFELHQHRPEWPNGNYLFALVAHPSGPKGQPDTGAGSKPITTTGLPKACSVSSHCTFTFRFKRFSPIEHPATRRALPGESSFPGPASPVERTRSFVDGDTGYGTQCPVGETPLLLRRRDLFFDPRFFLPTSPRAATFLGARLFGGGERKAPASFVLRQALRNSR